MEGPGLSASVGILHIRFEWFFEKMRIFHPGASLE